MQPSIVNLPETVKQVALCGPPGVGKTYGVSSLVRDFTTNLPGMITGAVYEIRDKEHEEWLAKMYRGEITPYEYQNIVLDYFARSSEELAAMGDRCDIVFQDRCILEERLFSLVRLETGYITQAQYEALTEKYLRVVEKSPNLVPDFIILISVDYETQCQRIVERGREAEIRALDEAGDYLSTINAVYQDYFPDMCEKMGIPVKIITLKKRQRVTKNDVISLVESSYKRDGI